MARDISQGIDPSMNYLSSAFNSSSSTEGVLSRMLNEKSNVKLMFCAECGSKCEIALRAPNSSPTSSEVYCRQHYEELFASKCEGCNKAIMGTFVNISGKKYHDQCYSQDISCGNCSQRIFGESVQACGKQWHQQCFKCFSCGAALGQTFNEKNGFPYCQKCASKPPDIAIKITENSHSLKQQQKRENIEEHNRSNQQIASNIQQGKLHCAECGKIIQINDAVSLGDSVFHTTCFCCAKCHKPLVDTGFKDIDGLPYCPSCSGVSGSSGSFCAGCGEKLVGKFYSALGSKWHQKCFVCSNESCKQPFTTAGYFEKEGMPYCSSCIKNVSPSVVKTIPTGERKKGFTVDPRSGTKKHTT